MKSILILYDHRSERCITGGQFYEENMYNVMLQNPEIKVSRISINRGRSFIIKLLSPILNIKYLQICKKNNLVIFNSVEGWYFIPLLIFIRLFTHTKIAIIHHHFMHFEFSGIKRLFYKILEITFLKLSNFIITVSPYIEDVCKQKFKHKNIRIWPIPFSDNIIVDDNSRQPGNLLYIGTIEPRKGLLYLFKSLILLKANNVPYELNIIGNIKDEKYYKNLCDIVDKNHLKVNFLGFINDSKKDYYLRKADIFVFPSLLEGYGMVLREVMSYGLPIICFNNSAMPYLVKNMNNGIIVENMDFEAMAKAITSIITNENLREKLSSGACNATKGTITPEKYEILLNSEMKLIL